MSDIKWEKPPQVGAGRPIKHVEFFAALRERPGEWAVFKESAPSSCANSVKRGHYAAAPRGEFDATAARNEDGTHRIYVRYRNGTKS